MVEEAESKAFYQIFGQEFAGRRSDNGERVCGLSMNQCIATFVDIREDLITPIPDHWSMEDAMTILMNYLTVWYGLIKKAQLEKSEKYIIFQ